MNNLLINPLISNEIKIWLEYLEKNCHYSRHTLIAYRHDLYEMINFFREKKYPTIEAVQDLVCIDLEKIKKYLEHRKKNDKISQRSLVRVLASIKSFYRYQEQNSGYVNEELACFSLSFRKKIMPKTILETDLSQILEFMKSDSHVLKWVCQRNYLICVLLYGCGLRISEVLGLRLKDLQARKTTIFILGKGKKTRQVPYIEIIKSGIDDYLRLCPHLIGYDDVLFLGIKGKPLSARQFYQVLVDTHTELNIPYHFSPHSFRHSCASHLLNDGANLRMIQLLLGHKNLSSTEHYLRLDHNHLREVMNTAHPRK